jgi:hypothetical protein
LKDQRSCNMHDNAVNLKCHDATRRCGVWNLDC